MITFVYYILKSMFDLDLIISQPQEAVFWFIPIIVGAAIVGAGTGALVGVIIDALCPIEGKTIAVLGMQGAGKTQFLANLKNVSYTQSASLGVESYKAFSVKIGDKTVKIEGGMDVPGGEEYIRRYYEDLISKNDIVFFLVHCVNHLICSDYRYFVLDGASAKNNAYVCFHFNICFSCSLFVTT